MGKGKLQTFRNVWIPNATLIVLSSKYLIIQNAVSFRICHNATPFTQQRARQAKKFEGPPWPFGERPKANDHFCHSLHCWQHSFASRVNATVVGWQSGSSLWFIHFLFPKTLSAKEESSTDVVQESEKAISTAREELVKPSLKTK